LARVTEIVGFENERVLISVAVNGAGNAAQSVAALNGVGRYLAARPALSVGRDQFGDHLL
jgi:hypothetical protein